MKGVVLTTFVGLLCCKISNGYLLCSMEFCESYLEKNKCPDLPEACNIQNFTHNGLELPFPGPCNCCDYCLENLGKEKVCAVGDPTSPMPTTICGDLLSCQVEQPQDGKDPTCEIMDTPCTQAQAAYDRRRKFGKSRELGDLEQRPVCDRNGLYALYACVPGQICYCVSEDGKRIFGEIPFTENPQYFLKCGCSRNYNKAKDIQNRNLHRNEFLRCQSNGDYDTLQCIGDNCLCIDAEDGHPTYPELDFVNVTLISEITLPCFDKEAHMKAEYYRECEALYVEQINFIKEYEEDYHEVLGYTLPNCQLDGYYAPVQETSTTKYCSNLHCKKLEDFEIPKSEVFLAATMNCQCARVRSLMTNDEKPECCRNGNYKKVQCRRGLCYCVDGNGNQTGKEVEYEDQMNLSCVKEYCIQYNENERLSCVEKLCT